MSNVSVELQSFNPETLASEIVSLYTKWESGRTVWLQRVKEIIQYVYATSTRETSNVTNPWSHSTVIPKLTQIHDNLGANYTAALFSNREFFTFEPANRDETSAKKRNAIINYLRTKHDWNGFEAVCKKLADDWVQTGNCFARIEYVREMGKDEQGEEYVIYEGPKPFRISPYDIVFDHTVAEFKNSPKIVRSLISRGELFKRAESPEGATYDQEKINETKRYYSLVAQMGESDINKHIQLTMDGFASASTYLKSGKCELLDFIGDIYDPVTQTLHQNRLITVLDRRCILRNIALDDLQGFGFIYHAGWRRRPDNLWAQGPLDNLVGMQYLINHLENARADGFDQMLSPDRVHIGQVEIEKDGPVTNYYIDDANGDVRNLAPDPTVLNADNQIALKEAQMEAYAGAPREAMGIRTPGEKTAFEVSSLQNAASRLFQTKIEEFEKQMIEPMLNGELEIAVRNLNTSDVAKVIDDDVGVTEFLTITKDDLSSKGKLKARGASHYAKRAQLVQELQNFTNVLQTDPAIAVHFPAKERAKLWAEILGLDRSGLYQPYGAIAEQVELNEMQLAAQQMMADTESAAMTDAEAQINAVG